MADYKIPFAQYLLPRGQKRDVFYTTHDRVIYEKSKAIIASGFVFEAEILSNGVCSFTITQTDVGDMSHRLSRNNTSVRDAIEGMIREFDINKAKIAVQRALANEGESDDDTDADDHG